jgi:hypothetical protein
MASITSTSTFGGIQTPAPDIRRDEAVPRKIISKRIEMEITELGKIVDYENVNYDKSTFTITFYHKTQKRMFNIILDHFFPFKPPRIMVESSDGHPYNVASLEEWVLNKSIVDHLTKIFEGPVFMRCFPSH